MQNHQKYDTEILNSDAFCRFSGKLFELFTDNFFFKQSILIAIIFISINGTKLNKITKLQSTGCCVTIATQQPDVSAYTGIYQMRCTAYKVAPDDGLI